MSIAKAGQFLSTGGKGENTNVEDAVKTYEEYHAGGWTDKSKFSYMDMVNKYYDLATSFYEFGWGESFHFAHRYTGETLHDSIKRYEHHVAALGGFKPGDKVLDIGCGVGGPAREVCRFSQASVTGVNNNAHQVGRAQKISSESGAFVAANCKFVQSDFMNMPFDDASYDHAFSFEATCHAPDVTACYKEIARCLKPGAMFVNCEWCLTDAFNPNSEEHVASKQAIEVGNGLPGIRTTAVVEQAIKDAGLELVASEDVAATSEVEWFYPIDPDIWRLEMPQTTRLGRNCSRSFAWCLEKVGLAPKGTWQVSGFLEKGQDGLCDGGRKGIFTPMFLVVARKPLVAVAPSI